MSLFSDAGLLAACAEAAAAGTAYDAVIEGSEEGLADVASALFDRETAAVRRVIAMQARTSEGLVAKAMLLDKVADLDQSCALALGLAKDAVALVERSLGLVAH